MFKQIVVGVDEHEGGRDAAALAENLLGGTGNSRSPRIRGRSARLPGVSAADEASERERAASCLKDARGDRRSRNLRWRGSLLWGGGCTTLRSDPCRPAGRRLIPSGLLGRVLIGDDTRAR